VSVVGGLDRNNQSLTARDVEGNLLWTAPTNLGAGTGSPAIAHGVLVVPGRSGGIEGFRASDGAQLWTKPVGTQLYDMEEGWGDVHSTLGTPAITDSIVYAPSLDGNLYALDLLTGAELWRWDFGVPVASSPAVSGNMLFVAAEDELLYGFVTQEWASGTGVDHPIRTGGSLRLDLPAPNPRDGPTRIAWEMPAAARVRVEIFDVAGRLVRTLVDGDVAAGRHEVVWDGEDRFGSRSSAGVYFARARAGSESAVRQFVRLRRR
jgi:outer membrane protein assembly factor BamB